MDYKFAFKNNDVTYKDNTSFEDIYSLYIFDKMLKLIENVGESRVISVIVDGLIFNNSKGLHLGDKTEFLGSLKEETYQALGRFKKHNQYVITEGEEVIIAHAGYDINIDNQDMNTWGKSPAVHIKEVLNEINVQIEDLNYEKN